MKLTKIFAGITALLLAGSALNAASVSNNQTLTVDGDGINFQLGQFNTNLGTLTGVNLTIYSFAAGSFSVQNKSTKNAAIVTLPITKLTVNATDGGGGMSTYSSANLTLLTSPSTTSGASVPASSTVKFDVLPGQIISNNVVLSIDSGSWDNYKGNGTVSFYSLIKTSGTVDGSSYTFDSALSTGNTTLTITYTYDAGPVPVPEASTVVVQLLIVAGGVWMFVRRRRAAAARA